MGARAKHLSADKRRAVAVEAVVELAATQNPDEITTAAVAGHMKLTQGALFRHFPTKTALWEAVLSWAADRLLTRLDAAAGGAPSPLAALEAMFLSHIGFIVDHPGAPRMILGELQRAELTPAKRIAQEMIKRYRERVETRLAAGKNVGEVDEGVDTAAAAILFIGTIQGLVLQALIAGDMARALHDAPRVFAIFRRGIAIDSARGAPKGAKSRGKTIRD